MFRTGSPYSPFFTSGLLSESFDSSSSSTTGSQYIDYRRRGSLPDVASGHAASPPKAADQSAFYFTLQPKRDANEFRSFLSLDLAESQSLRSGSEKQRISSTTASFWSGGASKLEQIPASHTHLAPPSTPLLRLRSSRDSLRAIPSPKPAPSSSLPDVPHSPKRPCPSTSMSMTHYPNSIHVPTPSRPFSSASTSLLPDPSNRASTSSLMMPPIARTAPSSPTYTGRLKRSNTRSTHISSSTVSTRYRQTKRSDALARLEGRSKSAIREPHSGRRVQSNFMEFNDDEDEDGDNEYEEPSRSTLVTVDKRSTFDTLPSISDIDEDADNVDMASPLSSTSFFYSASRTAAVQGAFHAYSHSTPSLPSLTSPSRTRRPSHRRKTSDWFPLHSFIDLRGERDDDAGSGTTGLGSFGWRSFIEFPGVS